MGLTLKLGLLLILAQASSSSDLNRRFDKALELQRKGDLRGAEAAYREVLKVAPRYGEARAAFEAELKRTPKDVSSLCYLASIDEKEGKLDSARKRLAAALSLEPGSADANGLLGRILLAQGKAAEAVKPLELAVAGDPADAQARYQLARAYQQLGRTKEAERELSEMKHLRAEEFDGDRAKVVKP